MDRKTVEPLMIAVCSEILRRAKLAQSGIGGSWMTWKTVSVDLGYIKKLRTCNAPNSPTSPSTGLD